MADKTQNNRFDADFQNMEAKADVIPQDEEKNKAKAEIMALRQKVAAGEITEEVRTEIIALKSRLNVPVNKEEVKEIVSEAISKDRIYVSFLLIDTLIKYLPEQDRPALKAYVGSMIVETFEKSGRVLTMKSDNTISISSLSNLGPEEEKKNVEISNMVNSLIKEWKIDPSILKTGISFQSQKFIQEQSQQVKKNPDEYIASLRAKKVKNEPLTKDEQKALEWADLYGVSNSLDELKASVDRLTKQEWKFANTVDGVPSVVGEGIGTIGGTIGKLAGAGAGGGIKVLGDILSSASKEGGAWGTLAVIWGLIAAIWKGGFWKTMGAIFGIGLVSEATAGRIDLDKEIGKAKKAVWAGTAAVSGITWNLSDGIDGAKPEATKPEEKKEEEKAKLTPSQEKANEKVKGDAEFVQSLNEQAETNAKSNNGETKKKTGKIEDYLTFINSKAFQNQKLENLLYTENIESSIFSNDSTFGLKGIDIPENLERTYLKRVLRLYIVGKYKLSTSVGGAKTWQKEQEEFIKDKEKTTYKDKTLEDLLKEINK